MISDKHKKRLKFFLIKLPIILAIFVLIMIGALKLVERYPDPLREGFEKYLSQQTKTQASISKVDKVAFYPNIDIQLGDITLHKSNNAALIEGEAEKFALSVPLSGLFVQKGRVNFFEIKNLKANKNIFTTSDIYIKNAEIIDHDSNLEKANIIINGTYGGNIFDLNIEINKDKKSYLVPKNLPFEMSLGDYKITASLQKNLLDVALKGLVFEKGGDVMPAKDYVFIEGQVYATDNPLACLYQNADNNLKQCDQYLKGDE